MTLATIGSSAWKALEYVPSTLRCCIPGYLEMIKKKSLKDFSPRQLNVNNWSWLHLLTLKTARNYIYASAAFTALGILGIYLTKNPDVRKTVEEKTHQTIQFFADLQKSLTSFLLQEKVAVNSFKVLAVIGMIATAYMLNELSCYISYFNLNAPGELLAH